jgi:hypothetical protein
VEGGFLAVPSELADAAADALPGGAHGWAVSDEGRIHEARDLGASGIVFLVEQERAGAEIAGERGDQRHSELAPGWREETAFAVVRLDRSALTEAWPDGTGPVEVEVRQLREVRRATAPNVVGMLLGSDPEAGAIVLTAHYDAYGAGPADESGDGIYNGALDNAAGTGGLIELARLFAEAPEPLPATLVFVATTAEERGTLGAAYYVEHPVVPLERTRAVLNVDGLNVVGATEGFLVFPSEGLDAAAALEEIGARTGMTPTSESWQLGMHRSFDTEPFLARGLAAMTLWQGGAYRGLTDDEVSARWGRFGRIHTPGDEWPAEGADLAAVAQHLGLYREAVLYFAAGGSAGVSSPELFGPAGGSGD